MSFSQNKSIIEPVAYVFDKLFKTENHFTTAGFIYIAKNNEIIIGNEFIRRYWRAGDLCCFIGKEFPKRNMLMCNLWAGRRIAILSKDCAIYFLFKMLFSALKSNIVLAQDTISASLPLFLPPDYRAKIHYQSSRRLCLGAISPAFGVKDSIDDFQNKSTALE